MKCISKLPYLISEKIRSYSVVESIYTVVSELLRNSIQAKSSEVEIIIDPESLSILVSDNGNGFSSHTLDLLQDSTLGTQSDPEGSLGSISLTCAYLIVNSNREGKQDYAFIGKDTENDIFKVYMDHFGVLVNKEGSIVMACRLFSDLPVRAQITRSLSKTEIRKEIKKLTLMCLLPNPLIQVTVSFLRDKEPFLVVGAAASSLNLYNAMYPNHSSHEINVGNEMIIIHGFCATQTRGDIRLQLILWDNDFVKLTKNELKAFQDSIKAFIPERNIIKSDGCLNFSISVHTSSPLHEFPLKDVINAISGSKPKNANTSSQIYTESSKVPDIDVNLKGLSVGQAQIISQIANQIVLIRIGSEMYFVDQHACDERIQYEMLFERFIKKAADSDSDLRVKVEESIPFVINDADKCLLKQFSEFFSSIGISYIYEKSLCRITHLPFCMKNYTAADGPSLSSSLLSLANRSKSTPLSNSKSWYMQLQNLPSCVSAAIALVACRLSIKFGQPLNHLELTYLIKNLSKCHLPFHCAHGRPTILPVAKTDLGTFNDDLQL